MNDRGLMLPVSLRQRLGDREEINLREPVRGFTVLRHGRIYEARSTQHVEARAADDGAPRLDGYATTYDERYAMYGGPETGYGWDEVIAKGAAAKSVRERDDVYLFFDHDGLPLASTKDRSLTLTSDAIGLRSEALLDAASPYSMEVYRRVQLRQLDRMSFAFQVIRERWEDLEGREESFMTAPVRRILEVKLYDTSVVSFPANPNTSSFVKNSDGMSLAEAKAELEALRRTA
jgi:HK97 family phage prohead protease